MWVSESVVHRQVGAFAPSSTEMFEAIKTRTAPESVVVFLKPRAMRLMTGRDALLIDQSSS
jgi:hypothetical protein